MNKTKTRLYYILVLIAGAGLLTFFDQWTKQLAVVHLKGQNPFVLIPGVLELQYLENTGAAFGVLRDQMWVFYVMTLVLVLAILWMFFKTPMTKRYLPIHGVAIVLTAGALGNLIDRVLLKHVTDFIYFSLIDFPIFNVADIYVVCSTIFIAILILFVYKDEDFDFLKKKK